MKTVLLILLLTNVVFALENSLPFCSQSSDDKKLDSIIYVSTLDGRITALDTSSHGTILWSVKTGNNELLSSTIQNRELTNSGHWVRMIPSLSGSLYKFDGETIDLVPVSADQLLTSSFKYSDDLVFAGGKEIFTYGINMRSGHIVYKCDMKGCQNETEPDHTTASGDILIVQKRQQTVHAIAPESGTERWNFSVAQHDLKVTKNSQCHHQTNKPLHLDSIIRVVLPEGLIFSLENENSNNVLWTQKLNSPIVSVWKWSDGDLAQIEIFETNQWTWKQNDDLNILHSASVYIGMHKKQLYIQESIPMQDLAYHYSYIYKQNLLNNKRSIPRIPWKPYPVSSASVTALTALDPNKQVNKEVNLELAEVGPTSLAVLYASKYINGNGFFLFSEPVLKDDDNQQTCDKSNETNIDDGAFNSEHSEYFFDRDDTPVQIVVVSLWFWWKEVLFISLVTALIFVGIRESWQRGSIKQIVNNSENNIENVNTRKKSRSFSNSSEIVDNSNSNNTVGNGGEFISRFDTDFNLIHCLGEGAFGKVVEVQNKIDDCRYAVKCINLTSRSKSRNQDVLLREVRALAKLDHRHIVRYYNAWLECPPANWSFGASHVTLEVPVSSIESAAEEDDEVLINYDDVDEDSFIQFEEVQSKSHSRKSQSAITDSTSMNHMSRSVKVPIESQSSNSYQQPTPSSPPIYNERRMFLYIQMQLCQKESLKEWMFNHLQRDSHRIQSIFEQILSAVEYVHLQGLIHRDLKPSNIFFSMNGEIKIGDFGLVTAMTDEEQNYCDKKNKSALGKHTSDVGTQLYMSPEQMKGTFYNYKVDIYSLGVIFFELLIPFRTEMERHKSLLDLRQSKYPNNFHETFPNEYALLQLMLSKNPENRPTTYGIRARPPFNHKLDTTEWYFELPPRN